MKKITDVKSTLEVPKHLRPLTRQWIQGLLNNGNLVVCDTRLLILAGQAWDDAEKSMEVLAEHGMTYIDRFGAPKARPEVAILRDARLAYARILKQLWPPVTYGESSLDGMDFNI